MGRVGMIVAATAAGAVEVPKSDAAQEVESAYIGLKVLLQSRYPDVDLRPLEAKPASRPRRNSLAEDLIDAGAGDDDELLLLAHTLLQAVRRNAPAAAGAVGIDLDELNSAFLTAQRDTGPAPDRLTPLWKMLLGRFWEFWKTLPGILTGIAALITAIVGLLTLFHAPGLSVIPWPPVFPPGSTTPSGVFAQGQLTMGADDEADLERGIVGNDLGNLGGDWDLWLTADDFNSRKLYASSFAYRESFIAQIQEPANEQKCTARLKVRHDDRLYLSRLTVGDWICISTSHGHVAALRVDRVPETPSDPERFDFTFITWKNHSH